MIRGVIFDLDGTLGDTLPLCLEAFRCAIREVDGRELKDEEISCYFGPSDRGVIRRLLPGKEAEWDRAFELFLRYYKELHPVMAPAPFPGVVALLEMLEERGICLGIVTGKEPESARITLDQFGLSTFFGTFVGTGSPEKVIKANRINNLRDLFGIKTPEELVYIGDVPEDVKSSRLAGAVAVSAAWASTADIPALRAAYPSHLFVTVGQLKMYLDKGTHYKLISPSLPSPWKFFLLYSFIVLLAIPLIFGLLKDAIFPIRHILLVGLVLISFFLIGWGLMKMMLDRR